MKYYVKSLLDTKKIEPMSREMTELFLKATMLDMQKPEPFTEKVAAEMGWLGKILYSRLQAYGGECTVAVAVIVGMLSKGSPGNVVMYAFTLARISKLTEKIVDTKELSLRFPWGFPTEEGLLEIWDAQKGGVHH